MAFSHIFSIKMILAGSHHNTKPNPADMMGMFRVRHPLRLAGYAREFWTDCHGLVIRVGFYAGGH